MSNTNRLKGKLVPGVPYSNETIADYLKHKTAFEAWQALQKPETLQKEKVRNIEEGADKQENETNTLQDKDIDIIIS